MNLSHCRPYPREDVEIGDVSEIMRYCADPAFAARMDAERDANRATANAIMDIARDRKLAARDAREDLA